MQKYLKNNDVNLKGEDGVGILSAEKATDRKILDDLFDDDELSLEDVDEGKARIKNRKETDAKINNSFTGPYPLDPTEFSHTDKGENYQFTTVAKHYKNWYLTTIYYNVIFYYNENKLQIIYNLIIINKSI